MAIRRVFTVPDGYLYHADDRAQSHRLFSSVMCLSTAEGGKPRLGGPLLAGAAAPTAAVSIRVLLPTLPIRYPAMTEPLAYPNSYSFLWVKVHVFG